MEPYPGPRETRRTEGGKLMLANSVKRAFSEDKGHLLWVTDRCSRLPGLCTNTEQTDLKL